MSVRAVTGLPVLSALEVALGQPVGTVAPRATAVDPDPVHAVRAALLPALVRSPCVVAFSGGRDSSLLLALAADLAAREGLDPPVAVTFRYPGDPAADESDWQELVVAHLKERGLPVDWVRHDVTTELDLIGPLTAPVLRAHGHPTYPAALGNTLLLSRYARGGALVTGNGGDEVLGGHRIAVLRAVARRRGRGLTAADRRLVAVCVAPALVRGALAFREAGDAAWLRPAARRVALAEAVRTARTRPLRWDRSVWGALAPRAVTIGAATRTRVVDAAGALLVEPLSDPAFVASYASFRGRWGALTRTAGMRLLAAGLLPENVLGRRDKAAFNSSRFGPLSRAFARTWDGQGVDERLVDPVALRAAWLSELPPPATAMLLQQAWLSGFAA
ncbi:asparagine synthase-related protein [Actinophytocola sp.]|uniref:asparagine synthase-related protein n=1 Tax=Actinophytocola sp. TaxID=1872138 RepID=UPI002ED55B1D